MFNKDFFPTPKPVIEYMLSGYNLEGKTILEPSAGKGDIVDYCIGAGAHLIACEKQPELKTIVSKKCQVIADDFLTVTSDMVSHIDMIVMNPPFSEDEHHILHAWEILPSGASIIALCNLSTLKNPYSSFRKQLLSNIEAYGNWEDIGSVFNEGERKTNVEIAKIVLAKPHENSNTNEFQGFFLEDDPLETQFNGLMPYNLIRDLVNRYVEAVKTFDQQLLIGERMHSLIGDFYSAKLAFTSTKDGQPLQRAEFKKELQKSAWSFVFKKLNMGKYTTKGLMQDINKFVETQQQIPFTMRNIYHMLDIVRQTNAQRMDRAMEDVFDRLTHHYADNRYNVEGWKTNSHYLVNKRFIMPCVFSMGWGGNIDLYHYSNNNLDLIEDLMKALCFISGKNYDDLIPLHNFVRFRYKLKDSIGRYYNNEKYQNSVKIVEDSFEAIKRHQENHPGSIIEDSKPEWGKWIEWNFFRFRCYKKGTVHFEFLDEILWAKFNQNIARIKGYPLPESIFKSKSK